MDSPILFLAVVDLSRVLAQELAGGGLVSSAGARELGT